MKTGLKYLKLEWINQKNYWEGEIFKSFKTHPTLIIEKVQDIQLYSLFT